MITLGKAAKEDLDLKGFCNIYGKLMVSRDLEDEIVLGSTSCGHIVSPPGMDLFDKSNINELELWPFVEGLNCWYPEVKGNHHANKSGINFSY